MKCDNSTTDAFAAARDQEQAWKHDRVVRYAVGFVLAGLRLLDAGTGYVGSDDVADDCLPGDDSPGIAGSAITMLRNANVIRDYWGTHADAQPPVHGGRRRSKRESANGRKVGTYSLASRAVAEEFLARNGAAVAPRQGELAI